MLGGYDYLDYVGVDLQTGRDAPFTEIIGAIFSPCHSSLLDTTSYIVTSIFSNVSFREHF
jgi:hypothetical protein